MRRDASETRSRSTHSSHSAVHLQFGDGIGQRLEVIVADIHALHLDAIPDVLQQESRVVSDSTVCPGC